MRLRTTATPTADPTTRRIERLNTASANRIIDPDADVIGELDLTRQVIPDELLSVAGLDVELTAGSLNVSGVPFLGRVRVTAGGAAIKGVRRLTDVLIQAGSGSIEGPINAGRSRVKIESGSLTVTLEKRSSVTVRSQTQLGRVVWPDDGGAPDEVVFGNGTARLDLEVVMGSATVRRSES